MARKLPEGAVRSFQVRIDTRPIRSTDPDHYHAFRASVALEDLPMSHSLGTWFKQTSTPDGKWFVTVPVDKANYDRRPPRFHEVTQDGTRARFLISPGRFEPYKRSGAASYVGTAYEMEDGTIRWPAPRDRCLSDDPTRTIGAIAGQSKPKGKSKPKREKIAALDADDGISGSTGQEPTLLSETPVPSFNRLEKALAKKAKLISGQGIGRASSLQIPAHNRLIQRITRPDGHITEMFADGTTVEYFPDGAS